MHGSVTTALASAHSASNLLGTSRTLNADGLVSGITHSQPSPSTMFQSAKNKIKGRKNWLPK